MPLKDNISSADSVSDPEVFAYVEKTLNEARAREIDRKTRTDANLRARINFYRDLLGTTVEDER